MAGALDCVVVGYNQLNYADMDFSQATGLPQPQVSIGLRLVFRSMLPVDGVLVPYLDAFNSWRNAVPGDGPASSYTVAELPNLGTLYLVNFLRRRGFATEFVNFFTMEKERLRDLLTRHDPLAVAITTTFYVFPGPAVDIVRFVRQVNPDTKIVLGGPLVDNYCRRLHTDPAALSAALDRLGADVYVWEGQGETALAQVVAALKERRSLEDVPNLFLRDGAGWRHTGKVPENNDLNQSAVDWDQFSASELGTTVSTRTARSCAFKCGFCDYPERAGALTLANIDTVERELEQLARRGIKRVAFIDDTFNVPIRRFKELLRMMVRRSFGIEWFSYFRCSNAQEPEVYELMRESGCRGVLLGVEAADDVVLKNMDKEATVAKYRYGIEQLNRQGIFSHASLVVGFPGESQETVQHTVDFLNDTAPTTWTINTWYYNHSAPVHRRAAEFGLEGEGLEWTHKTMRWQEAADASDYIFREVQSAAWLPVDGLDFWSVPYLMGKGMEPTEIVRFLRLAKDLVQHNIPTLGDGFLRVETERSEPARMARDTLRDFCQSLTISPSRYGPVGGPGSA